MVLQWEFQTRKLFDLLTRAWKLIMVNRGIGWDASPAIPPGTPPA